MRDLKTPKTIKIDKETVIKIEIDKLSNRTIITTAAGYDDGQNFIQVENPKQYKIKNIAYELSEAEYFAEVDKQNSPSLVMYGLLYRAKQAGVSILYAAKQPEESLSVSVADTTITISLEPLVTTNQEIIDAIRASSEAMELIYTPEAIDLLADVDTPNVAQEIK